MLTEQRYDIILKLLEERKSVTVTETERSSGCVRIYGAQRYYRIG